MNPNHDAPEIEQKIDAALKILSEVQPRAAMTSGIHRSLGTAVATSGKAHRGGLFWVPATCAAVATVLLVFFSQVQWTRGKQAIPKNTKIAAVESVPSLPAPYQPRLVPSGNSGERKVSSVRRNLHRRRRNEYRHAANLLNYPLTQQEKLLVKFAQNAKLEDLRDLNPEYQRKVEAEQNAEFAAYVKSGTLQETIDVTETN